MSEFFRVGHYFDQQDAERTRPSNWNAKSKSSVIWGRYYGCRV